MTDIVRLIADNGRRWNDMHILPELSRVLIQVSQRLIAAKERYQKVSTSTGVPWHIIAVIHEREASQSWRANLAQGDPWDQISIHVPRGRGPFVSWEAAAIDALANCAPYAVRWHDWTVGGSLTLLEQYNGLGYAIRGIPSPYIWASTDQYVKGKYIADGHFDPDAIDHQLGCAALLKTMAAIDTTIKFPDVTTNTKGTEKMPDMIQEIDDVVKQLAGTLPMFGGVIGTLVPAAAPALAIAGPILSVIDEVLQAIETLKAGGMSHTAAAAVIGQAVTSIGQQISASVPAPASTAAVHAAIPPHERTG